MWSQGIVLGLESYKNNIIGKASIYSIVEDTNDLRLLCRDVLHLWLVYEWDKK